MKTKVLLRSLLWGLLVSGYPIMMPVQAEPSVQVAQSQWQPFSDSQGGFTVLMPVTPTPKKQTQESAIGKIDFYSFTASQEEGSITYLVSYNDFPSAVVELPPEVLLDSLRSAFVADRNVRLVNEEEIRLGNYPGREFKIEIPGKTAVIHRAYLVGPRLYQLVTETPLDREQELSGDTEKFFSSFELE